MSAASTRCHYCGELGHHASQCAREAPSYHHQAERISLLMTYAGATLTEHQQNVLAASLAALQLDVPRGQPATSAKAA
jgi:hypothetical protein